MIHTCAAFLDEMKHFQRYFRNKLHMVSVMLTKFLLSKGLLCICQINDY